MMRTLAAAVVAIAVLALGAPGTALGVVEVSNTVRASGDHTATAPCPAGMHVVSGGGMGGLRSTLSRAPINLSLKSGNGWIAGGYAQHDNSPSHQFDVTAYAYCGRDDLHLATFASDPTTGMTAATAHAVCTIGHVVSGGGAVTSTYGMPFAYAMSGNGWLMGADSKFDGGSITSATTRAEAYCTAGRYDLTTATDSQNTPGGHEADVTVTCPAGTELVSGGGSAGDRGYIWLSQKQGNGWRMFADNMDPSNPTATAVYAYCIHLPNTAITKATVKSKAKRASFSFTGSGGGGTLSFRCKLDKNPTERCSSPRTYAHLKVGTHVFQVIAIDPAGRADPSPATKSFKVKKTKKKKKKPKPGHPA